MEYRNDIAQQEKEDELQNKLQNLEAQVAIKRQQETLRSLGAQSSPSNTWMIVAIVFILIAIVLGGILLFLAFRPKKKVVEEPMYISMAEIKNVDNAVKTISGFQKKVGRVAQKGSVEPSIGQTLKACEKLSGSRRSDVLNIPELLKKPSS